MQYAGFWRRFFAMVIDGLMILVLSVLLVFLLGFFVGGIFHAGDLIEGIGTYAALIDMLILWLYFALQESGSKQATLGKRVLGIYVTTEDEQPLSFAQASIRHFAKYLSSIFLIGFIMAAFTQKKQGLHDMMASALVLKR